MVDVVGRHHNGAPVVPQFGKDGHQGGLGGDVHAAERFIQQQDVGALGQGAGQKDALALAAGEFIDEGFAAFPHPDAAQGVAGGVAVGAAGPAQPADAPHPAQHHHLPGAHRDAGVEFFVLRHIGHRAAHFGHGLAVNQHAARRGRGQGGNDIEQGAFAGPVGAHDAHQAAGAGAETYPVQDPHAAVFHGDAFGGERGSWRWGRH